jgi:predicted ABC-type ATPase
MWKTLVDEHPSIVVIAGPNGAGKTTISRRLLMEQLGITEFVNADSIAAGLSAFAPQGVAMAAGRIMIQRLNELARERKTFAFETTLSGRSYARWLRDRKAEGYKVDLVYVWVDMAALSAARVRKRVLLGGHDIPPDVISRRYLISMRNFFELYRPLADKWRVYDNSGMLGVRLIAKGNFDRITLLRDRRVWERFCEAYGQSGKTTKGE